MNEDPKRFIKALQQDLNSNSAAVVNNFDQLMAIFDLMDPDSKVSNIKTDISMLPTAFNLSSESIEEATKLKNTIDSHIEVTKYDHRYVVSTQQVNNVVKIQLTDKHH